MIKNWLKISVLSVLACFFLVQAAFAQDSGSSAFLYFTGVGCPHCANSDPVVLEELPLSYPNLFIIEYEVFKQKENAFLIQKYDELYKTGLGVPLVIAGKETYFIGDTPIIRNIESTVSGLGGNSIPLADGTEVSFDNLDLNSLPGKPKIWHKERILIKEEGGGDSAVLKRLLSENDLIAVLEDSQFEMRTAENVVLSGKTVKFENAIKVSGWVFQWNSKKSGLISSDDLLAALGIAGGGNGSGNGNGAVISASELTFAKVLSLAAADSINPCAIAVLALMLISILSYNKGKKKDVLLAGAAFIAAVFIMYLIYGFIIIKAFQVVEALSSARVWLYRILGAGAVLMGGFKVIEFIKSKNKVCKPNPKVEKIVSKVTSPKGAFAVGAFVTLFLLPCTIGPYVLCGGILCPLGFLQSLPWLLFYNLIFVLPMVAVVVVIYFGLSKIEDIAGWQARNTRYLELISGAVMFLLGIGMSLGII